MELKITPSGQTIVKPTALGPVANTDTKLLIYGLFQKGRVLAQDAHHPIISLSGIPSAVMVLRILTRSLPQLSVPPTLSLASLSPR